MMLYLFMWGGEKLRSIQIDGSKFTNKAQGTVYYVNHIWHDLTQLACRLHLLGQNVMAKDDGAIPGESESTDGLVDQYRRQDVCLVFLSKLACKMKTFSPQLRTAGIGDGTLYTRNPQSSEWLFVGRKTRRFGGCLYVEAVGTRLYVSLERNTLWELSQELGSVDLRWVHGSSGTVLLLTIRPIPQIDATWQDCSLRGEIAINVNLLDCSTVKHAKCRE